MMNDADLIDEWDTQNKNSDNVQVHVLRNMKQL